MTTRYTNPEWHAIISSTLNALPPPPRTPSPPPLAALIAIARAIDHTLLKLDAKATAIDALCSEARVHSFASVLVRPPWVSRCVKNLKASAVVVGCEMGGGGEELVWKVHEARAALQAGATALSLPVNTALLLRRQYEALYTELSTLRLAAKPFSASLTLAIPASLDSSAMIAAAVLAAAADFANIELAAWKGDPHFPEAGLQAGVRTEDVEMLRRCTEFLASSAQGARMRVKVSGGVRTVEDAREFLAAGAETLGGSGGVWILREAEGVEGMGLGEKDGGSEMGSVYSSRPGLATRLWTDS